MQGLPENRPFSFVARPIRSFTIVSLLLLLHGCIDPCGENPCDDDDPCTTDTCEVINNSAVCTNTVVDCGNQVCNPADGQCVDCFNNAGCTNADFCDGEEICVDNACTLGTNPCPEDEMCDEDKDRCVDCLNNEDCLNDHMCNDGDCIPDVSTPGLPCLDDEECDDGLFCNGVEFCGTNGECQNGEAQCPLNSVCNEATETCPECITDSDCGDDDFCVGTKCIECRQDSDCEEDEGCDQDSNDCISTPEEAMRSLPPCYTPAAAVNISIVLNPSDATGIVGIEDSPPADWTVSNVSHEGVWDTANGTVKWVFRDGQTRTLTYSVMPPASASGEACFDGQFNADGTHTGNPNGTECIFECN